MKKKFKYILLLLFIPLSCNAEISYTDYSLYEKESLNYYEETELLKREEIKHYLNYKYEKSDGDYFLLNENPINLPLLDNNDYINENIRMEEYSIDCEGPYSTHHLNENFRIRYIKINNFNVNQTFIKNISIYLEDNTVFYYIYDKNFYFNENLNIDSEMIIDLRNHYLVKDLNITINFNSIELNNIEYDFSISDDLENYHTFNNIVLRSNLKESHIVNFTTKDNLGIINYFNKEVIKYKYYKFIRINSDIYTKNPVENYEHDLTKFISKYNYYLRDKIEISNEITNINDPLIKYSSNNILSIDNLNLFENGTQNISICLINNKCLNKDILINIKKTKLKDKKSNNDEAVLIIKDIKNNNPKVNTIVNNAKDEPINNMPNKLLIYILFSVFVIMFSFIIIIKKRNRLNVEYV